MHVGSLNTATTAVGGSIAIGSLVSNIQRNIRRDSIERSKIDLTDCLSKNLSIKQFTASDLQLKEKARMNAFESFRLQLYYLSEAIQLPLEFHVYSASMAPLRGADGSRKSDMRDAMKQIGRGSMLRTLDCVIGF